jgi:hypothetical protein
MLARTKMAGYITFPILKARTMDAERINLIGTQLTDLSARTQELRGYL